MALASGLDRPGVNPVPRIGASEATGPPGLEHPGGSGKRTNAWNPDWNIRGSNAPGPEHPGGGGPGLDVWGRSGPGLERPGLQKEEDTATERSGEENMNKGKEQMRKDTKNRSREAKGEGEEGEAAKDMEPGQEQPGKQRTRTRTSGGKAALDWSVRDSIRMRKRRRQETARRA